MLLLTVLACFFVDDERLDVKNDDNQNRCVHCIS